MNTGRLHTNPLDLSWSISFLYWPGTLFIKGCQSKVSLAAWFQNSSDISSHTILQCFSHMTNLWWCATELTPTATYCIPSHRLSTQPLPTMHTACLHENEIIHWSKSMEAWYLWRWLKKVTSSQKFGITGTQTEKQFVHRLLYRQFLAKAVGVTTTLFATS